WASIRRGSSGGSRHWTRTPGTLVDRAGAFGLTANGRSGRAGRNALADRTAFLQAAPGRAVQRHVALRQHRLRADLQAGRRADLDALALAVGAVTVRIAKALGRR